MASVDVLILPYASADGRSLLHFLIEQFDDPAWTHFTGAVAFLNASGNLQELLEAMLRFAERGSTLEMTFGADSFAGEMGSDYEALRDLVELFADKPDVKFFLYHEPGRTFHPKVYLFHNEHRACMIVGSSNWSHGGFIENVEANLITRLNLEDPDDHRAFAAVMDYFATYWRDT